MFRILFLLTAAITCFSAYLPKDEPTTEIEISYVEVSIYTRDTVDCSSFTTVFAKNKTMKQKKIVSGSEKTRFIRELASLEKREGRFSFNARAQIIIKTEDGIETICADHLSVFKDGQVYAITPKIRNTIWKST